jgi:GNAT superfamily N-acetyltransferase
MEITLRKATEDDLNILLGFEQELILAERPFDPTLRDPVRYYDINFMLESPTVELIVAQHNEEIIGCGYARKDPSKHYLKHTQHAYLGFMYVVPEYRGKGANKMIINRLTQWANKQGLNEMRLEVYAENISAIKAYEKAGFTNYMMQMRKDI